MENRLTSFLRLFTIPLLALACGLPPAGSALAAEGIFAFFLESGFLAVLVFGWDRVSPKMHFFSTCMVAAGSTFSALWIVIANSWQQTPAGHHVVPFVRDGVPMVRDGEPVLRAEIVDFWALVFNPSTIHRLVHVWIGAFSYIGPDVEIAQGSSIADPVIGVIEDGVEHPEAGGGHRPSRRPLGDGDRTAAHERDRRERADDHELLRARVHEALGVLTWRERAIIEMRFGLGDGTPRTLEEVGTIFKVTRERVRQIEAKALRKLRHPSRSRKLKGYGEMV